MLARRAYVFDDRVKVAQGVASLEYPHATVGRLFLEHAIIDVSNSSDRPCVGERITVTPNYINGVAGVFDTAYGVRGDDVEAVWSVAGRGRTA